ncbi:hypothetical protein BASA50_000499 [Batrachochytrium salamandrivorans]|uniref:Tubulin-specific chaperone A n=1 Tax=Batrachochytrium salamandrivorans TaxID=1357716 RepID=A0ABQ8ETX5_9FUNG|nr:hypothetical protein BASA60_011390 [Batrachochytrium salamandrivorans]KAH6568107.1 hypothetical protein BASA62_005654 [Batrachochytrium salamandrivorans]KAH6586545.1 hypothetical protein BASA50_000499 [Batrachochytrium salamandrivorans]KAH9275386.1 hypothetical protein BASA83_002159 [Batrachochytrium salamandrivorans]KAJ1345090.1 hypothetical protein BSLG_000605 [Batrachochytrium salamandrivorans]
MEPATVTLRELKIKAGVVKRTSKEYHAYMKESTTQQARIDALIARSADDADIRKQREVLEETTQMLPDTKRRLMVAHGELACALEILKDDQNEEILAAHQILKEAVALID